MPLQTLSPHLPQGPRRLLALLALGLLANCGESVGESRLAEGLVPDSGAAANQVPLDVPDAGAAANQPPLDVSDSGFVCEDGNAGDCAPPAPGPSVNCEAPGQVGPPNAFFVAPGASGGTGTLQRPFGTLEGARDAIRSLATRPAGGVDVYLRGGNYPQSSAFQLAAQDSGSAGAPVRYRAYGCERPRIIGGKAITGWSPLTSGAIYNRLPAEARSKVVVADLRAQGITDYGSMLNRGASSSSMPMVVGNGPLELFYNGEAQHMARFPNVDANGDHGWLEAAAGSRGHDIVYEGTRPTDRKWTGDADGGNPIMVRGYLHFHYRDGLSTLQGIDGGSKTLTITDTADSTVREGNIYYVYNVLEELDAAGEYWLDRATGKLYFWPPAPLGERDELLVSLLEEPIVKLVDTSHVVFENLQIEVGRSHGVRSDGGVDITFDACTVRNVGWHGVYMDWSPGEPTMTNYTFRNGEVYATGIAGVILEGGDRRDLVDSQNLISNSHIHHFGRLVGRRSAGVTFLDSWYSGAGGTVEHSLIENGPGICVRLTGPLQTVEHNVIRDCAKDTGDLGAIYYGYTDPATRGIKIRYNMIGDSYLRRAPWGGHGSKPFAINCVYVDNAGSGGDISMNLIYNCDIGLFFNSGKFNHVKNNILFRNKAPRRSHCKYREPVGKYNNGVQGLINGDIHTRLASAGVRHWTQHADPWTPNESWATQLSPYDTKEELEAMIGESGGFRTDGIFTGNLNWHAGPYYIGKPDDGCRWRDQSNNLEEVDPGFVNEAAGNYRLRPDTPAANMDPPFPVAEWNAMIEVVGPDR